MMLSMAPASLSSPAARAPQQRTQQLRCVSLSANNPTGDVHRHSRNLLQKSGLAILTGALSVATVVAPASAVPGQFLIEKQFAQDVGELVASRSKDGDACFKRCSKECNKIAPGSGAYCQDSCKEECDAQANETPEETAAAMAQDMASIEYG
eukprot:CAMPEP_0182912032 /NCGR_PEP_ID=MMETSP0034_2-20130328/37302_1 /TAXON_ID=156128 /ORGANISM="Nephroselmis pyriformis, Strain CCMP717" /LENGTH=151 /DNA_ID=CAMNT_0025048683 /DNA_START=24 /DNA_END=476 /DNA_ORIENTATION=+